MISKLENYQKLINVVGKKKKTKLTNKANREKNNPNLSITLQNHLHIQRGFGTGQTIWDHRFLSQINEEGTQ